MKPVYFVYVYLLFLIVVTFSSWCLFYGGVTKKMLITVHCPADPKLREQVLKKRPGENFIVQCSESSKITVINSRRFLWLHMYMHYGPEQKKNRKNSHLIIHCPTSEGLSEVSDESARANGRVSSPVLQSVFLAVLTDCKIIVRFYWFEEKTTITIMLT